MDKLASCLSCGCFNVKYFSGWEDEKRDESISFRSPFIRCETCGFIMTIGSVALSISDEEAEKQTIAKWNTRPLIDRLSADAVELAEYCSELGTRMNNMHVKSGKLLNLLTGFKSLVDSEKVEEIDTFIDEWASSVKEFGISIQKSRDVKLLTAIREASAHASRHGLKSMNQMLLQALKEWRGLDG